MEIKFRAWSNELEYLFNVDKIDFHKERIEEKRGQDIKWSPLFRKHMFSQIILEQYTGLKDKNKKLIYESDLIKPRNIFNSFTEEPQNISTGIGEVYWSRSGFKVRFQDIEQIDEILSTDEIIGNIHEE